MNYIGLSPVEALIYAAVFYGITAPVLIAIVLHIAYNKKIMGDYTNGWLSNLLGILTLAVMGITAGVLIYLQSK